MACKEGQVFFCEGKGLAGASCTWQGPAKDLAQHEGECFAAWLVMMKHPDPDHCKKWMAERQKHVEQLEADLAATVSVAALSVTLNWPCRGSCSALKKGL